MPRSKAEWETLFVDQTQSGLSTAAYCREHKLCAKNFSLRRRQLNIQPSAQARNKVTPPFVKVNAVDSPSDYLEIKQGSVQLQVPLSVSAEWIATLVIQLR